MKIKYSKPQELADLAIHEYINSEKKIIINEDEVGDDLKVQAACFVTVYIKKVLRGCIGTTESKNPLYKNIIDNSILAVTRDIRFPKITKGELTDLQVEVSVLSPLEKYEPLNNESLKKYLNDTRPGLMIEKSQHRALFLPQVWEDLSDPVDFLNHLCFKAGLNVNDWKKGMNFYIFNAFIHKTK